MFSLFPPWKKLYERRNKKHYEHGFSIHANPLGTRGDGYVTRCSLEEKKKTKSAVRAAFSLGLWGNLPLPRAPSWIRIFFLFLSSRELEKSYPLRFYLGSMYRIPGWLGFRFSQTTHEIFIRRVFFGTWLIDKYVWTPAALFC